MRWGLIPLVGQSVQPFKEMKPATFNARVETVTEKPMFRGAFQRRRCLIPASGGTMRRTESSRAVALKDRGLPTAPHDARARERSVLSLSVECGAARSERLDPEAAPT
jgi:putative SOS response-associated peptidase YedK